MAKTAMIRARITPALKTESEKILKRLGLSTTEAITLFLTQIRLQKGLPFKVEIPNKKTRETFKKTDEGKELVRYDSVDEFIKKMRR